MEQLTYSPEQLRGTIRRALEELADDARHYLQLLEQLEQTSATSEAYRDAEVDLDLSVTNLMVHTMSLHELFEELTDALPDDDE